METDIIPLGERAQKSILDHVVAVGDAAETSYLEVKSELDPASKQGVAKVAKFLLGVANRLPQDAARHFNGYAVLVIGAQEGAAVGIPRGAEAHDLENRLRPYLGPQFPAFEFGRIAVDANREVLFIVAQPPKAGQSVFPCHKEFQDDDRRNSLEDGAIYVRGASNTRPARTGEVLALVERARGGGKAPISLDVEILGSINRVGRVNEAMQRLYDLEEQQFAKGQQPPTGANPTSLLVPHILGASRPASDEERAKQLEAWKRARPRYMLSSRLHLLGVGLPGVGIQVISHDRFVAKPHLTIKFHDCEALDYQNVDEADLKKLVEPVVRQQSPFGIDFNAVNLRASLRGYPLSWSAHAADVEVVLTPESFRPNVPWTSDHDDFVLLARDLAAPTVAVSWVLTEEGNDATTTGVFDVVTSDPVDALDLVKTTFFGPTR